MSELQSYDKHYHLNNAKSLIEAGDNRLLRYACLELRMLIEAHVYKRLLLEIDDLPRNIISTWQPNKAVKLDTQFDKYADMDLHLTLGGSSEALEITYNNIKSSKLTKIYHSLGSYLHLPTPQKVCTYDISKEKIIKIYNGLERLLTGNIVFLKIDYMAFECKQCGEPVLYTDHYLEYHSTISCQNDACEIEYDVNNFENKAQISTNVNIFSCSSCASTIPIPYKRITDGYKFKCPACEADFKFELVIKTNTTQ